VFLRGRICILDTSKLNFMRQLTISALRSFMLPKCVSFSSIVQAQKKPIQNESAAAMMWTAVILLVH
jgi:hypothetical protein